jgi:predicted ATPase
MELSDKELIISHNLPPQPTAFVGREEEIAALADLLDKPDVRLLTILGPGGIGKTRLALAIAEHQLNASKSKLAFPDGIFFVALAPLSTTDAIVTAVAEAVGFQFGREGDPQEQLLSYLKKNSMLLVLDNLEHLLNETTEGPGTADLVNRILDTALTCKILVTSRERVKVQRETLYQLGGLDFPDWETPEDALRFTAVQLFMQSAKRVRPDFELTTENMDYAGRYPWF